MRYNSNECIMQTMTVSITIRNVPREARDALAARAAGKGQSLQAYLRRRLIDLASKPDPGLVLDRIERRKQATGSSLPVSSILSYLDQDRR